MEILRKFEKMTIKTPMFQMVELIIAATITNANQFVYFQQQPQLQTTQGNQTVYIKAIETYSNFALATSPMTAGNPVATAAQLANAVLTINVAGTLKFQSIPLANLNRVLQDPTNPTPGVFDLFQFRELFQVDWTKSYVQLLAAPSGTPYSYLFGVHYSYEPDNFSL